LAFPIGKGWWILLPFVLALVSAIGVYFPYKGSKLLSTSEAALYLILSVPLSSELFFRSLVHGILVNPNKIQSSNSRWSISSASVVSASLYSVFMVCVLLYPDYLGKGFQITMAVECLVAAWVLGLFIGALRERSQSVLPGILFHALGLAALIAYYFGEAPLKIGFLIDQAIGF
jgi:hypothetical protein